MPIVPRIAELHGEMRSWRRDIHAQPELGFEEERTSEFVARKLEEFGCEVHNASYDFNDEALPYGASFFARLVEKRLAR